MQTIVILLDPEKLENPDLDLRYEIPDRIEEATQGAVQDNGYDYIEPEDGRPGPLMGIWLAAESAEDRWPEIWKLFQEEQFLENDLTPGAEIYISKEDAAELDHCTRVVPE